MKKIEFQPITFKIGTEEFVINSDGLNLMMMLIRSIRNEKRLAVLNLLLNGKNGKKKTLFEDQIKCLPSGEFQMTVTAIFSNLRWEQSVASQHLRIMFDEGLVKKERDGKFIWYSLNFDGLVKLATKK